MEKDILIETGAGELEILEFTVNGEHYGINVIKVREILEIANLTKLPLTNPSMAGITLTRGEIISVVNLNYVFDDTVEGKEVSRVIVCEFNQTQIAFTFDDIIGIHRITWKDLKKPGYSSSNSSVIGNVIYEERIILLLDFEKIVTDINPDIGMNLGSVEHIKSLDRSKVKLVLADDSKMIRELIRDTLSSVGYEDMKSFDDGEQVLEYLLELVNEKGEDFSEDAHVLITDIEMPQMDGHTLTRKVKEHEVLKDLPVIIFSSLITDDLRHKGSAVGADAQISKPEIGDLVELVDRMTILRGVIE